LEKSARRFSVYAPGVNEFEFRFILVEIAVEGPHEFAYFILLGVLFL
jgi:hypothetical protein